MRVIAGSARGTHLKVPQRLTRPSTDRLREALFSILGPQVEGAAVLDLFAGSGALGIEALSRGAASAMFVEASRKACEIIGQNLEKAGVAGGSVASGDVFRTLVALQPGVFGLIFADPPYAATAGEDFAAQLLEDRTLPGLLQPDGLLVVEVESGREVPEAPAWRLLDRRVYGSSAILFYGLKEGA